VSFGSRGVRRIGCRGGRRSSLCAQIGRDDELQAVVIGGGSVCLCGCFGGRGLTAMQEGALDEAIRFETRSVSHRVRASFLSISMRRRQSASLACASRSRSGSSVSGQSALAKEAEQICRYSCGRCRWRCRCCASRVCRLLQSFACDGC